MMKKSTKILLTVILLVILGGCVRGVGGYTYKNSGRYTVGNATVTGKVKTIDISWIAR